MRAEAKSVGIGCSADTRPILVDGNALATHYQHLRTLARRALRRGGGAITIQPTELAHEAAIRMLSHGSIAINDEAHLLALCARVLRTTLIEEVRRRRAAKRDVALVTRWDDHDGAVGIDLEQLDGVLDDYAAIDPDGAAVVQLRVFVGLTMAEIARELRCSESTALRRWRVARAWLIRELATE